MPEPAGSAQVCKRVTETKKAIPKGIAFFVSSIAFPLNPVRLPEKGKETAARDDSGKLMPNNIDKAL